jgi:hypothetical protein
MPIASASFNQTLALNPAHPQPLYRRPTTSIHTSTAATNHRMPSCNMVVTSTLPYRPYNTIT